MNSIGSIASPKPWSSSAYLQKSHKSTSTFAALLVEAAPAGSATANGSSQEASGDAASSLDQALAAFRVAAAKPPALRQYEAILKDLGYTPESLRSLPPGKQKEVQQQALAEMARRNSFAHAIDQSIHANGTSRRRAQDEELAPTAG